MEMSGRAIGLDFRLLKMSDRAIGSHLIILRNVGYGYQSVRQFWHSSRNKVGRVI